MSSLENMHLLWSGEWPLWQTVTGGLLLVVITWWIYRTEVRKGTTGKLRWILPCLRCTALFMVFLVIAGPVLQLEKEEGNRGKITVFIDSSQSMSLKDSGYSSARKVLLAKEHGFLPEGSDFVDYTLYQASRKMKRVALLLSEAGISNPSNKELKKIQTLLKEIQKNVSEISPGTQILTKKNHLLEEIWLNIDGSRVEDLFANQRFKEKKADRINYLTSAESNRNIGDLFGRRISGYLTPLVDGEYTFCAYSDDSSILRIARPESNNFKDIIVIQSNTSPSWENSKSSTPLFLKAGKAYPIQMIHKEGSGDDFCAFGWTLPSGNQEKPVPGKYFNAPILETENGPKISFEKMIQEKFSDIKLPLPGDDSIDYDALSREATEIVYLLEENFERYANSLLKKNIIPLNEAVSDFENYTRINRATRLLAHPKNGFLDEFQDTHILEIRNLSENATDVIWDNFSEFDQFDSEVISNSPFTDLSKGILESLQSEEDGETELEKESVRAAAVLITDGGHNQEGSPLETAKLLSARNLPIYTIGIGSDLNPPDLALLRTTTPESVYREDRVQGNISIKDNLIAGTPYRIKIQDSGGKNVWEKSIVGVEAGISQLSFDFPAKEVVERKLAGLAESEKNTMRTVSLNFRVSADSIEGEAEPENNQISFSIDANMRRNRLLLIDSRPRWETRYLNNLFSRDERWEISCVWGDPNNLNKQVPRGKKTDQFPDSKNSLFEFDIIIFGEINPEEFSINEQDWLVEFVNQRGGGILFIDGPRQKLRSYENSEIHPLFSLLPVSWQKNGSGLLSPKSYYRPEANKELSALILDSDEERNEELWKSIPLPAWTSPVESLPGSEVFLEVSVKGKEDGSPEDYRVPAIVGKTAGAGKSFYIGFDESWRWRYEVADQYHQRFWNQIISRVMERPFSMNQGAVSLDVGGSIHDPGKSIPIRVRLRNKEDKTPKPPYPEVDALIWKGNEVVATTPLKGEDSSNGLFTGQVFGLSPGSYEMSIRAPDLMDEMELSQLGLPFQVKTGQNEEKNFLTCDENLLREMAEASGGNFIREENFHELKDKLRSISSGRIIITEIILWQSFGWLGFIVLLLALEMFLRKRAGML
ncbi:VWA domain-containing protein [Opitutales bacterium]|nr:VWA domain-containing protein [Opitutales bacterium]